MHPNHDIAILWQVLRDGHSMRCVLSAQRQGYELRVEQDGQVLERAVQSDETRAFEVAQVWRRRYVDQRD